MSLVVRRIVVPVLAAALVIGAGWLCWDFSSRRAAVRAGEDATRAARDSIVAILSYQSATVQQSLQAAAQDRLTGKFLDDYTQLIKTVVVPEAVSQRITVSAKVPATAVVSADAHRAVLLAYVDQTTAAGSAAPTQSSSAVRVTMDNVDGRWLISGFDPM